MMCQLKKPTCNNLKDLLHQKNKNFVTQLSIYNLLKQAAKEWHKLCYSSDDQVSDADGSLNITTNIPELIKDADDEKRD